MQRKHCFCLLHCKLKILITLYLFIFIYILILPFRYIPKKNIRGSMRSLLCSFCSLHTLYQFPQTLSFEFPHLQLRNACDAYPEYFSSSVRLHNVSPKPEVVMSNYKFQGTNLNRWQNNNKKQIFINIRGSWFQQFLSCSGLFF